MAWHLLPAYNFVGKITWQTGSRREKARQGLHESLNVVTSRTLPCMRAIAIPSHYSNPLKIQRSDATSRIHDPMAATTTPLLCRCDPVFVPAVTPPPIDRPREHRLVSSLHPESASIQWRPLVNNCCCQVTTHIGYQQQPASP